MTAPEAAPDRRRKAPEAWAGAELVPVAERLRSVRWLRLALAAAVVAAALAGVTPLAIPAEILVATAAVYVVGLLVVEQAWRRYAARFASRGTALVGLTLLIDGVFLAWSAAVTGGAGGVAPLLVLLHVVGVTLLVSYRTGVKLALWHSLLVYGAGELHGLGLVALGGLGDEPLGWRVGYVGVVLLVVVGTASFSAINERELRRRRVDLEALADLATELEQAETPEQVAQILATRVRGAFDFARLAVVGGPDSAMVLATAGVTAPSAELPAAGEGSLVRRACAERRTQLADHLDASTDPGLAALLPDARNVLVVPLVGEEGGVEALVAEHGSHRGSRIERRVVSMVERFADHGALALRAARLLEEVQTLATTDGLTGLATRRVFDEALRAELSRAIRTDDSFALLLLDIDHFKLVNDVHGHQTGDEVLRGIAANLVASSRDFDLVARYGGEEFAVIAPGCDEPAALAVAERLRSELEQAALAVPVTVSVGVGLAPTHATEAEMLVGVADRALLVSKREGRNQVTLGGGRNRKVTTGGR